MPVPQPGALTPTDFVDAVSPVYGGLKTNPSSITLADVSMAVDYQQAWVDKSNPNGTQLRGVDFVFDFNATLLLCAVGAGRMDIVEALVDQFGALVDGDLSQSRQVNTTPLHVALANHHSDIVKYLISKGGNPNATNSSNETCNDVLVRINNTIPKERFQLLCEAINGVFTMAAVPEPKDEADAVVSAGDEGRFDQLKDLLDRFPILVETLIELDGYTTNLLYTAARGNNVRGVGLLVGLGADPNQQLPETLNTPLHVACYRGHLEVVREFVASKSHPPNYTLLNALGETCLSNCDPNTDAGTIRKIQCVLQLPEGELHQAILSCNTECLGPFIQAFTVDATLPDGQTLLSVAISTNSIDTVDYLLKNGANPGNPNHRPQAEGGPLLRGRRPISELLAAEVADGQATATPPLLIACQSRSPESVRLLADFGAPVTEFANSLRREGRVDLLEWLTATHPPAATPTEAAVRFCLGDRGFTIVFLRTVIPALLQDTGVAYKNYPRGPLLCYAARSGNDIAVRELLEKGANPDSVDSDNMSPLQRAVEGNQEEVVRMLLKFNASLESVLQPDDGRPVTTLQVLIRRAHEEREKMKRDAALAEYIASLAARNGFNYLGVFNPTDPGDLMRALGLARTRALQDEAKSHRLAAVVNDNPLSRSLLDAAVHEADSGAQTVPTLSDWMAVPAPGLFPNDPSAALKGALVTKWKPVYDDMIARFVPAVQSALGAAPPFGPDAVSESASTYAALLLACRQYLEGLARSSPQMGRFSRALFLELIHQGTTVDSMYRLGTITAACTVDATAQQPTTTVLASIEMPAVNVLVDFVNRWTHSWADSHKSLKLDMLKIARQPTGTPAARGATIDAMCVAFLGNEIKKLMTDIKAQDVALQPVHHTKTVADHCSLCVFAGMKHVEQEYFSPVAPSTPVPSTLVDTPVDRAFVCGQLLKGRQVITTLDKAIKSTTQPRVTPACRARFEEAMKIIRHDVCTTALTSIDELVQRVLRKIHLHTMWHLMPIYETMGDIEQKLDGTDVILVEAATGSGKSVLLPQYLTEKGHRVHVTCPRRLPVLKIGEHVAEMVGRDNCGFQCGGTVNPAPRAQLQYSTDALYLNSIFPQINGVADIVVIDEVHERSSTMDSLLLLLLSRKKNGSNVKVVLASATVDPTFFKDTVNSFGLTFGHVTVSVKSPFPVTVSAQSPLLEWPESKKHTGPKRVDVAVKDAIDIIKADPVKHKILVFLPHVTELTQAENKLRVICAGKIPCGSVHATAVNAVHVLQTSKVIFANQVAETSLTIDGLTHVLDFNLTMVASVDRSRNCRTLKYGLTTASSQRQREGRLGRTCAGTYKHYYDITNLPAVQASTSFDLLLNDTLLQLEMRFNHFLTSTLFTHRATELRPLLGLGVDPTDLPFDRIPVDASLGATLNLTPSMARSLAHTLSQGTCPLAILWLSTLVETRISPLLPGYHFTASAHKDRFGNSGDFGILFDVFNMYLSAMDRFGGAFDPSRWSRERNLNEQYWVDAASYLSHLKKAAATQLTPTEQQLLTVSYSQWQWDDIEDALMAGHSDQVACNVRNNLNDLHHKGPYVALRGPQTVGLTIYRSSVLVGASVGTLPDFVIYSHLECRSENGRRFLMNMTRVSRKAVEKWISKTPVHRSIGLIGRDYNQYKDCFPSNVYPKTTIETNNANFTTALKERAGNGFSSIRVEFQCSGSPLEVMESMESVALDVKISLSPPPPLPPAKAVPSVVASFGKPPAILAELRQLDMSLADRLERAYQPRQAADLKDALVGNRGCLEQGIAVCNVLLNECDLTVKGGAVRDIICRGKAMTSGADFDCEASNAITFASWQVTAETWRAAFLNYGIPCSDLETRKSYAQNGVGIIVFKLELSYMGNTEIEVVTPWNTEYIPVKNMDFSCNNLRIEPHTACEIRQSFPIMMTGLDIATQLLQHPKPHTSPTRDCEWVAFDKKKRHGQPEGLFGHKYVEGTTPLMKKRIAKFRGKDFLFVEQAHATTDGLSVVLFHGTTTSAMNAIIGSQQFIPSTTGFFGPGVYLSRDMHIVRKFASPCILKAQVDPGIIYMVPKNVKDIKGTWQQKGFDSAFVTIANSFRAPPMEEWCVASPSRITNIEEYI